MDRMKVFLSYSSADRDVASRLANALENAGDDVFFDRSSLPVGKPYDVRIMEAVQNCDLFLFLTTPAAVSSGSYALAELSFAQQAADIKDLKILPVMLRATAFDSMPPYLRGITILQPTGDVVAESTAAVAAIRATLRPPVLVTVSINDSDWIMTFQIADDRCTEIFFRFSDEPTFRSTGFAPVLDPRTGLPMPMFSVRVPSLTKNRDVLVKYTDQRKREHGPYSVTVDRNAQLVRSARQILDSVGPLVAFAGNEAYACAIFKPPLLAGKEAIADIQYSIDNDSLASHLSPTVEASKAVIEIPTTTSYIYMKLVFVDGSERPPERFARISGN